MNASAQRRRFRALLTKEFRQIVRDQSTFLIAFVLPVILMFLMGFGVNLDPSKTRIGIVMQDDGCAARAGLVPARSRRRVFKPDLHLARGIPPT